MIELEGAWWPSKALGFGISVVGFVISSHESCGLPAQCTV
jgi:hypothetical protein